MHPQLNVSRGDSYLNSPQVPANHRLSPLLSTDTIVDDQQTTQQFNGNETKETECGMKAGSKRVCQPPDIFVFDFTNTGDDGDRLKPSKQICITNGNGNDIDIPVALDSLTQKPPFNPSTIVSHAGPPPASFNSSLLVQPQQLQQNVEQMNNGNQNGDQHISLSQSSLQSSRNASPNCHSSQTMLWC